MQTYKIRHNNSNILIKTYIYVLQWTVIWPNRIFSGLSEEINIRLPEDIIFCYTLYYEIIFMIIVYDT